ncbi:MAG: hypothetical protein M3347_11740, partial [Armatimonadota bacterium]|nr:hypothetical protein [Armatimonadota bacterium]
MYSWQIWVLIVLALEIARECWVVWGVARRAEQAANRGDWESACAIYEKQARMKAPLLGLVHPFRAHYRLGQLYTTGQRYEDAVRHWQILLERAPNLHPGVAADIRQRLANCLEGCGRTLEAQAQRDQAQRNLSVTAGQNDLASLLAHADALEHQRRYVDAYATLERALPLAVGMFRGARVDILVRLANVAWNAGRVADGIRYAEQALQEQPQGVMLGLADRMAALCYGTQGDLDQSEAHRAAALEVISKLGDESERVQALGELAETIAKRGRVEEALAMVESNAPAGQPLPPMLAAVRHMCLMAQGRFDEARQVLEDMRGNIPYVPDLARRMDAAILMDMARSEAEAGRGPEAWPLLCEAEAELMR